MSTKKDDAVAMGAVRAWAHRMSGRTGYVGAEAVALSLCGEGSEYVAEIAAAWEGDPAWEAADADGRARIVAAVLLENADAALEMLWEHMWDYDKTCDPSWLEG